MKTTIINGQNHKGSTYHIAHMLTDKIGGDIEEFFLPRDFNSPCTGCNLCFMDNEEKCPHYKSLKPITKSLFDADLIILTSPVYVYHCTGQMKTLLDHYGYMCMIHRPREEMFNKQTVVIATAAGGGTKSTIKDISDSLFFYGISYIYKMGFNVKAIKWTNVSKKTIYKIDKATSKTAKKIKKHHGKTKMKLKNKILFKFFLWLSSTMLKNPADLDYLQKKGWIAKR